MHETSIKRKVDYLEGRLDVMEQRHKLLVGQNEKLSEIVRVLLDNYDKRVRNIEAYIEEEQEMYLK